MRNLKFRAWDNGMEMMVYQGDDEIYICFDGEKWKLLDYYGTHWETDEHGMNEIEQPWEVENIEIMQWTGLKDKNGVEIYEGDFLMAGDAYLGVIKYHSTRAQFIGKNIGETFQEDEYDTLYTKNGRFNSAKVIGNIYENPELLED